MSMKKSAVASTAILLSTLVGAPLTAAGREQHAVLTFSDGRSSSAHVELLTAHGPQEYRLWLRSERDLNGAVSQFVIEMNCSACRTPDINQMYDGHPWHGIQPFMFTVGDRDLSAIRHIELEHTGVSVTIEGQAFRICRGRKQQEQFCGASIPITVTTH